MTSPCTFLIRSSAFESRRPKPDYINERCFGDDLAAWLRGELIGRAATVADPIQEDWGWALPVSDDDHVFLISIGVLDTSIGASPADWRLDVTYDCAANRLRHLLRRPDPAKFAHLCQLVANVLGDDSRVDVLASDASAGPAAWGGDSPPESSAARAIEPSMPATARRDPAR